MGWEGERSGTRPQFVRGPRPPAGRGNPRGALRHPACHYFISYGSGHGGDAQGGATPAYRLLPDRHSLLPSLHAADDRVTEEDDDEERFLSA